MKMITIPPSKSISNRVLILAAIGKKPILLKNLLESDDTVYMRSVLTSFGVKFEDTVEGVLVSPPKVLEADGKMHHIGNAGTVARFVPALSLVAYGTYGLDGVTRMRERPQKDLFAALRALDIEMNCEKQEGFLPARFTGRGGFLDTNVIKLSGKVSSQFVSALLLVAARVDGGLVIEMEEVPPSQPYVDMTLEILKIWGVSFEVSKDLKTMTIKQGLTPPLTYEIPADMSGASYPCAWATLMGEEMKIEGFGSETLQGDEQFLGVCESFRGIFEKKGEDLLVKFENHSNTNSSRQENDSADKCRDSLHVRRNCAPNEETSSVSEVLFDFSAMPDVAMTGMILACFSQGTFTFTGLESLRVKECDRIQAMVEGFIQLGIEASVKGDDMMIKGGDYWIKNQSSFIINSYDDHRIAMCFGVLRSVLGSRLETVPESLFEISQPECVAKTWPGFWIDLADWEGRLRPVSASIITRPGVDGMEYLLVQKPRKENAWQFPQGGVDPGENPVKAAGRELMEECGDDIHVKYLGGRPVGDYRYFFPQKFQRWQEEHGTEQPPLAPPFKKGENKWIWKGACVSFYTAQYIDGEVVVDGEELIDHKWLCVSDIQPLVSKEYWEVVKDLV